jgi:hypothetical protein
VRSFPLERAKERLIYEGTIGRIETVKGSDYWVVSGQRFLISGAFIDAHPQPYAVGARVQIDAQRKGEELVALRIVVLSGQHEQGEVKLEGIAERTRDGWTVGGIPIALGRSVEQPIAGMHVLMTGSAAAGSGLTISDITTFSPGLLRLQGPVQRTGTNQVVVAGVPIIVREDVEIMGTPVPTADGDERQNETRPATGNEIEIGEIPVLRRDRVGITDALAVGSRVVVWGKATPEGTWQASYIDVLDSTTRR